MLIGAALSVTALGLVAVLSLTSLPSSKRGPAPAPFQALAGRVMAVSPGGRLVSVDPVSGKAARLPVPAGGSPFVPASVSPNGQRLLDDAGMVFNLTDAGGVTRSSAVSRILGGATSPVQSMPFADNSQALLALTRPAGGPATALVVSLIDGREFDLGVVDSAGGDAQSLGAFVSVPSDPSQTGIGPVSADAGVELRIVGKSPELLSTSAEINEYVGAPPSRPVTLSVYPNPTGDAVAVAVNPLSPSKGNVAMVVLNRQGRLLASFSDRLGPIYGSQIVWSPGGHQLAYPTHTVTGPALATATETGTVYPVSPPAGDTTFGPCVWSPTSTEVVCQSQTANGNQTWLYATSASPRMTPAPSPGYPLAWISIVS
jgi:hypothetical protein